MEELIFQACKDLVDDAKLGCADLVFKDICLDVLARASRILSDTRFKDLVAYTTEQMHEKEHLRASQKIVAKERTG
jgi:hypothetical protein